MNGESRLVIRREHPLLDTTAAIVMIGALAWTQLPRHDRALLAAMTRRAVSRALTRVARWTGQAAMTDELSGRREDAAAGYRMTYLIGRLRDRCGH